MPALGHSMLFWTVLIFVSIYMAAWIHELGHWVVGKIGRSSPELKFTLIIVPTRVKHHQELNDAMVRVSGLSPIIWLPTGMYAALSFFFANHHPVAFVGMVTMLTTVLAMTEGDRTAITDPESFRVQDEHNELSANNMWVSIIFRD